MHHQADASHIGSSFSCVEILVALYFHVLKIDPAKPKWPQRDRLILSKGHAASVLYATLAHRGFFDPTRLNKYCQDGSRLLGHVTRDCVPGVEVSTGSLGHGLPLGIGMGLAACRDKKSYRTFIVISDGECNEGSVWEAAMFASHHKLDNIIVIIDVNRLQAFGSTRDIIDMEPMADKWRSFGWAVRQADGHDVKSLAKNLDSVPFEKGKPSVLMAHTVKGKGVSFMENQLAWHYRSPKKDQYAQALEELDRI